jgi:hypothetical protein
MIAHIYPSVLQAVSGRGYAGCLDRSFQGYRGEAMQDLGYELPRIPIPRTQVNKGKRKGRGSREAPALPLLVPVAYLARTFQVRLAGLWSVLPAASVARTLKVWDPLLRLL